MSGQDREIGKLQVVGLKISEPERGGSEGAALNVGAGAAVREGVPQRYEIAWRPVL